MFSKYYLPAPYLHTCPSRRLSTILSKFPGDSNANELGKYKRGEKNKKNLSFSVLGTVSGVCELNGKKRD